MNRLSKSNISKTLCLAGLVLMSCALTSAQVVRPRKPSQPVTKGEKKPYKTGPTRGELDTIVELIRHVQVGVGTQTVTISFSAVPNTVPLVELAKTQPRVVDGRWQFPTGSGSVTRPAGGDKANGAYTVDMNQDLEPGSTYYYIISNQSDDSPNARRAQVTGKFSTNPANFLVRYRGFICEGKTDGPGADEIYAIISASFADPAGRPGTVTERHPAAIVEGVESGDVRTDPGRDIYQGKAQNLLLSITLMEHDDGDPYKYRNDFDRAVVGAYAKLVATYPQLLFTEPLTGSRLASALFGVSDAIERAFNPGDDVIGTTTRLITTDEMRSMANQPSTVERGIQYNFFTWHRGHGGIYRVYFDIIQK